MKQEYDKKAVRQQQRVEAEGQGRCLQLKEEEYGN